MNIAPKLSKSTKIKTLVFCTGYANNQDRWNSVYGRWLEAVRTSNLTYDQILIPDDGSEILPSFFDFEIISGNLPDYQPLSNAVMYHWKNHLGRPAHLNCPGWHRVFMFAAEYAKKYGFQKIIHLEVDSYLISERMQCYVNEIIEGWVAMFCPRHKFPESAIQIIAGKSFESYYQMSKIPYNNFINRGAEHYLPYTYVNKDFIGDRYGEYLPKIPNNADYACQVHHNLKVEEVLNMALKTKKLPSSSSLDKVWTLDDITQQITSDNINTNRVCIINQFLGLGDIIFCEPIARMYYEKGYKVVWPVDPIYCNINKHFPYITFINKKFLNIDYENKSFYSTNGTLVIPLRFSDGIMKVPYRKCMESKYMMWNLPLETWRKVQWQRDEKSEKELFFDILDLKIGEKYNLISNKFSQGCLDILPSDSPAWQSSSWCLKNVYIETISDYTLIDWSMVMENATTIHMVHSAINYILEFLNVKAELHLYPRKPIELDFSNYNYLFIKPYVMHL